MTDKNDVLFLVRLPFGQKTIPYKEVSELIATAKSPGYDSEKASEHDGVMLALGVIQEEKQLEAAVLSGEVEVLGKSLHRMGPPFIGRLEDTVLTVRAFRKYVESIHGFLEVEDAPEPQPKAAPSVEFEYSIDEDGGTTAFRATPEEYAAMVAKRKHQREARHKVGHYTMFEAAEVLQTVNGREAKAFLFERMVPAVVSGALSLIDPKDGGPVVGRACRPYQDWVTPPAIDEWLTAEDFAKHVRWPESAVTPKLPEAATIAREYKGETAKAPATGPKFSVNKAALIAQHKDEWPTIESDIKNASENGLSKAAKAGVRDWNEEAAMQWARSKNKLIKPTDAAELSSVMSGFVSRKHRIER